MLRRCGVNLQLAPRVFRVASGWSSDFVGPGRSRGWDSRLHGLHGRFGHWLNKIASGRENETCTKLSSVLRCAKPSIPFGLPKINKFDGAQSLFTSCGLNNMGGDHKKELNHIHTCTVHLTCIIYIYITFVFTKRNTWIFPHVQMMRTYIYISIYIYSFI